MPARSKKRAKFNFDGREFLWHVDADTWLRICSSDKHFVVAMLLYHSRLDINNPMYLEVIGQEFPAAENGARPIGLAIPDSVSDEINKSMGALVNAILEWSFNPSSQIQYHPLCQQLTPSG